MKNTINFCLFFLVSFTCIAQVGVGTVNPQEALHIAGNNSTIRIDGLSNNNNSNNLGGQGKLYNVLVDHNGSLALGNQSGEILSASQLASPVIVHTTTNSSLQSAQLYHKSFTLTQRALVVITYYVALDFRSGIVTDTANFNGTTKINDGRAKIAHNYFYLGDGTTANTAKTYGMTSIVYSNVNCDTATGRIYNSRSTTISLDAGTHSVHLFGAVYGGGITSDAAFSVSFGNGDRLDIQAIYL